MSFRTRLTLFFVLIVVLTMVAVGVVVFRLIEDSQAGKADARSGAFASDAIHRYRDASDRARLAADRIAADPRIAGGLTASNPAALRRRAVALLGREQLVRLEITRGGRSTLRLGDPAAVAAAAKAITFASGAPPARVIAGALDPKRFARELSAEGVGVVVRRGARVEASTLPGASDRDLPRRGGIELRHHAYRVASFDAPDPGGPPIRVSVLTDSRATSAASGSSRTAAVALLVGFLLLSLLFALLVSRALQGQVTRFLKAAQRLGSGDFSTPVPAEGRDEFAALGREFNRMSSELERRLEELRQERARLRESIRRIGESFASNLDRRALLELSIRTAVDAVGGAGGRATARPEDGGLVEQARIGSLEGFEDAVHAAERATLRSGDTAEEAVGDSRALAIPLGAADGEERLQGILTVVRRGPSFDPEEREILSSLAGQAAVSLENVTLHEHVRRQAITDELTGLSNHRRFQEVTSIELERARRFDHDVGLVLLDVDNFKRVNDTYGHQQGDAVLRAVARVLRESCREIEEPARYGGEELAVTLPETDLEGAYRLAERVRAAVEELEVPLIEGAGRVLVTASIGVASARGARKEEMIEAADRALYEAKRSGKNRTVRGALAPVGVGSAE